MKKNKYILHNKNSIFSRMKVKKDINEAFDNAIKKGMHNSNEWMYMYSSRRKDYFKHYWTREYCSYTNFRNLF